MKRDEVLGVLRAHEGELRARGVRHAGLKRYIAELFDGPVDVVNRDGLKAGIRPVAVRDLIYAF